MSSFVFSFLLAVIFLVLGFVLANPKKEPEGTATEGIITKSIQEDGYTFFYVDFNVNGKGCTGTSLYYSQTKGKLAVGSKVPIEYYVTPHNKRYRVRILLDGLVPCGTRSVPRAAKVCKVIGLIMMLVAVVCCVRVLVAA